jgi:hypothetical protein
MGPGPERRRPLEHDVHGRRPAAVACRWPGGSPPGRVPTVAARLQARQLPGPYATQTGGDMARFPSAQHLASWCRICPANNESAGKHKPVSQKPGKTWLGRALIQAAKAAAHTKGTYFGAQYRQIARRRGPNKAAVAVAHSMVVTAWYLLSTGQPAISRPRARPLHQQRRPRTPLSAQARRSSLHGMGRDRQRRRHPHPQPTVARRLTDTAAATLVIGGYAPVVPARPSVAAGKRISSQKLAPIQQAPDTVCDASPHLSARHHSAVAHRERVRDAPNAASPTPRSINYYNRFSVNWSGP